MAIHLNKYTSDFVTLTVASSSLIQPQYTLFSTSEVLDRTKVEGLPASQFASLSTQDLPYYPNSLVKVTWPKALVVALTYPWASQVDASQARYTTFPLDSIALPIVSLNAPKRYFFGKKGLYSTKKEAKQLTKEYLIHIQMLNAPEDIRFSGSAQASVAGHSTQKLPMKSLNLHLERPSPGALFFGDTIAYDLSSIRLRNAGNDFLLAYMRDAVVCTLSVPTHNIVVQSQPVAVFINGEFWGLQYLQERIDEPTLQAKYPNLNSGLSKLWSSEGACEGTESVRVSLLRFRLVEFAASFENVDVSSVNDECRRTAESNLTANLRRGRLAGSFSGRFCWFSGSGDEDRDSSEVKQSMRHSPHTQNRS
ncbi:MAG: CotH kinase family protein [Bacteroidota bacterium]